jgi:uncharacterized protein YggE
MRKVLALAVAIAAAPLAASAQQLQLPRDTTIVVSITRTGRAPADRVSLYFGVESVAETTPLAIDRLQSKIKAILDSVKRASPSTQADVPVVLGAGPAAPNGYPAPNSPVFTARAAVRVTVSKLTELPTLQLAAASAGAMMSGAPQYESSTIEGVWKTKSAEALTSARAAAEASADAQGYKLGRMLSMNVSGGPQNAFQQQAQLNFDPRSTYSQLFSPDVIVNATVSATYLLVKK